MPYIRSFYPYELRIHSGKRTVVLPKAIYQKSERDQGKRSFLAVTDGEISHLKSSSAIFRALLAKGASEGYTIVPDLPDSEKTAHERVAEANARAKRAEDELAQLKGEKPKAAPVAETPATSDGLDAMSRKDLIQRAKELGVDTAKKSNKQLIEAIRQTVEIDKKLS